MTFEWISDAHNKAADYLSCSVDVKDTPTTPTNSINTLVTSTPDGPAIIPTAKHIIKMTPHHLQILQQHQPMTKWMHLKLSQKIKMTLLG